MSNRRADVMKRKPIEQFISNSIMDIECMPADVRLSRAQIHLQLAFDYVADFYDGQKLDREPDHPIYGEAPAMPARSAREACSILAKILPEGGLLRTCQNAILGFEIDPLSANDASKMFAEQPNNLVPINEPDAVPLKMTMGRMEISMPIPKDMLHEFVAQCLKAGIDVHVKEYAPPKEHKT